MLDNRQLRERRQATRAKLSNCQNHEDYRRIFDVRSKRASILAGYVMVMKMAFPPIGLIRLNLCFLALWLLTPDNGLGQAGSLDPSFDPGAGVDNNGSARVSAISLQSDGKVLIGGDFVIVNRIARPRVARLNANGALDLQFDPGVGPNAQVLSVIAQPNDQALIAGAFTEVAGVARNRIARLDTNGSLDVQFTPNQGANLDVDSMALQSDGKVIIGGSFDQVDGVKRVSIARLKDNGKLDAVFDPGQGANSAVLTIAVQSDGKVLIGGSFSQVNGVARPGIARLNSDGSLDSAFTPGTGPNDTVNVVMIQPDGKIVIGGAFTSVQGTTRNKVARLTSTGSLDLGFNPGAGANLDVLCLAPQTDGKILVAGNFLQFNGVPCNSVARLNPDGTLDPGFISGLGTDSSVQSMAIQSDGRVLVGGYISSVNGIPRRGIARLLGDAVVVAAPTLTNPMLNGTTFTTSVASVRGKNYVLQYKTSLTDAPWIDLAAVPGNGSRITLTNAPVSSPQTFYRVLVE